jgi:NitT/TauT family transport system substrate-binding protein
MRALAFLLWVLAFPSLVVAADKPTLVVGHDQWIGYCGVFIAKEKKFFDKAGLNVELKPFSNPGDTLPALAAGKLDLALTTLHNLGLIVGTSDVEIVAVYLIDTSSGADAIVAKPEVQKVADLKGKNVAVTVGEVNEMLLKVGLERSKLEESDVKIVNLSADDAGAAFLAGKVDAAVTWEPWVSRATEGGGHVIFSSAEVPNVILDSVAVSKATLGKRRADILSFLAAVDRGVGYLRANPEEARIIIGKYLEAEPDAVKGMLAGDKIYGLADNKDLFGTAAKPGAGYDSMSRVVEFLQANKLVQRPITPAKLLEPSLIRR